MSNGVEKVDDEMLSHNRSWREYGTVHFKPNSELLVLVGAPEEDMRRRGISYYVWGKQRLKLS